MFIIGTGRRLADIPPRNLYKGILIEAEAARQQAIDTASMALAPREDLSSVPSFSIMTLSTAYISEASIPQTSSFITVFMLCTALMTPFPIYLWGSLSLSSRASNCPVEAPLGEVPIPRLPSASQTSASTVGFPLESSISLPVTFSMRKCSIYYYLLLFSQKISHAFQSKEQSGRIVKQRRCSRRNRSHNT